MFRQHNNNASMPSRYEAHELDLKMDVDRASIVFLIRQTAMNFGSDRGIPVPSRPAVLIRQRDGFWFVLPSTTHHKSQNNPEFRAISKGDVMWSNPEKARDGYLYYRYETISGEDLIAKIGVLFPAVQVDIVKWLRSRY
jgi:hypothetical protein